MSKRKNFDEKTTTLIIDQYKQGRSVPELSRDYKTTPVTIYALFKKHKIELIDRPRKYINRFAGSPEFIAKLKELMASDRPRITIADELGVPVSTLYHYCDKHNIPLRVLNGGKKIKLHEQNFLRTKGYYYLPEPPTDTVKLPFATLAFVEGDGMYVQVNRDTQNPDWRIVQPKNTPKKGWFSR